MFYTFTQNNSGGVFYGAKFVIIEADSHKQANQIAEENDVYFDGVSRQLDCECCGDRWYPVDEYDGHSEPMIYGKPAEEFNDFFDRVPKLKIIRKENGHE